MNYQETDERFDEELVEKHFFNEPPLYDIKFEQIDKIKLFIHRELSLQLAHVKEEVEKILTVDVEKMEWTDQSKKWKHGIEPCIECENAGKILDVLTLLDNMQ